MTLQDIFEYLTSGELQSTALGNNTVQGSEIAPEYFRPIISHINLAIKELYKRFWLSSKEVSIQLYDHITTYELASKYASSNEDSVEIYKYILDSVSNPFQDDVLKIEQIFNEDGEELALNDSTVTTSLYTPTYKTIQTPSDFTEDYTGDLIIVQYRATHPVIPYTACLTPEDIEIDVPDGLLEALLAYVGYRAQLAVGSIEAQQDAMFHLQRFEMSCSKAQEMGLGITTNYTNSKLDNNGWL